MDLAENRSFAVSGRHRGAVSPSKEVGGASPPTSLDGFKAPGAAQTPKATDFQPSPKPPSAEPPSGNRRKVQSETCDEQPQTAEALASRTGNRRLPDGGLRDGGLVI